MKKGDITADSTDITKTIYYEQLQSNKINLNSLMK